MPQTGAQSAANGWVQSSNPRDMMPLISESYRAQNAALHASNPLYGVTGQMWAPYVQKLIEHEGHETILDYGSGKGTLKETLKLDIAEYDPCIEGKNGEPEPADLVVCNDVLEHVEPVHLNAVIRHIAEKTKRKAFLTISTVPSTKTLEDGRNAHLIIKQGTWWREKLSDHFRIVFWQERPDLGVVYCELAPKGSTPKKILRRFRRPVTPEMVRMVEGIREVNHRYSDPFARLNSFAFWEGIDDTAADMQIVWDVLEHVDDIDAELCHVLKFAQKAIIAMVPVTQDMNEKFWRRVFDRRFHIGDWQVDKIAGPDGVMFDRLIMSGSPKVAVAGVTAVGAVAAEDRWQQVLDACKRVQGRIPADDTHGKKAILACYGPSLRSTVDVLKDEAARGDCVVISVSGAHDFLIANGITPDYHVECDPRPHKADNIERAVAGVQYLIGSSVHPVLIDKLLAGNADVRLWHVSTPEHAARLIEELNEPGNTVISGGGSVGLRSVPLFYAMGFRDFSIYGMDCSFETEAGEIVQWAGKHAGKRQDACEVSCGDRLFISSPILLTYATSFFEMIQRTSDITYRLYGDGLLQSMCRMYADLPQFSGITLHDLPQPQLVAAE